MADEFVPPQDLGFFGSKDGLAASMPERGDLATGTPFGGSSLPAQPLAALPLATQGTAAPGTQVFEFLPSGLLWHPPLATPREPRCSVKFFNVDGQETIDTGIGATFGLARLGPADHPDEGWQLDAFAVVFTRFSNERRLTATDLRVGLPFTWAANGWQMKLGYEHSGAHLGDEYMLLPWEEGIQIAKRVAVRTTRDEVVTGVARTFAEQLRLYGQLGYAFAQNEVLSDEGRTRFDWGAEYSFPQWGTLRGGPFAALDMEFRPEQDFSPNLTVQVGWQWKTRSKRRSSGRVAAEYYAGHNPYGQFLGFDESWWAFCATYEW